MTPPRASFRRLRKIPAAAHLAGTADRIVLQAADYQELKRRGVEFTEEPEERPYGIDSGFRVPSGNTFRLTQVADLSGA